MPLPDLFYIAHLVASLARVIARPRCEGISDVECATRLIGRTRTATAA